MIQFNAAKPAFQCVIEPCPDTRRARWSDGHWADICVTHLDIFRKNCRRLKGLDRPLWFLGTPKKETPNP